MIAERVPPSEQIAVISPHLDDAIFSLGGTIAAWTRAGGRVVVVTVLANDPGVADPPSSWDCKSGFASASDAAWGRRAEDLLACSLVGAESEWLPFGDKEHARGGSTDDMRAAIERATADAEVVLAPGYPLTQFGGDHLLVTTLVLTLRRTPPRVGLYVEQPYAANRVLRSLVRRAPQLPLREDALTWTRIRPSLTDWRLKQKAIAAYESQLRSLGLLVRARLALYELVRGGEGIAWLPSAFDVASLASTWRNLPLAAPDNGLMNRG